MSRGFAELLVKERLISQAQFQAADEAFNKTKEQHMRFLVRTSVVQENKLQDLFAAKYKIPVFDIARYNIDPEVVKVFTREDSRKYRMIPVQKAKGVLVVALADPTAINMLEDVKFRTQMNKVEAVITTLSAFETAQEKFYGVLHSMDANLNKDKDKEAGGIVEELNNTAAHEIGDASEIDAPVIQLVNSILIDAIRKKASDIHVEPYEHAFRIRLRIDGVLYEVGRPNVGVRNAVIARIKIMAKMDIAERRLPQDGRIKIRTPVGEMDFRVSSLPTVFGEKLVLRLLNKGGLQPDLSKLGMEKKALGLFTAALHESYGMVLVTGPTGSGKTSTLYSGITELNKVTDNISTAEDPVEYNLEGVNQVQTHAEIGLTFAAALRTFMRQDPDIILVGEIRDFETAEVAIQAALTGHLVMSTVHTNDAPSTVTRLLNMGIEPFLVTAAINLVCGQRLLRQICPSCKVEVKVPIQRLIDLGIDPTAAKAMKLYKGAGCPTCSQTGYSGRFGIFEVMPFTPTLKEAVLSGANSLQLKRMAIEEGMKTLRMGALTKVSEGRTTLEEALANTAADF